MTRSSYLSLHRHLLWGLLCLSLVQASKVASAETAGYLNPDLSVSRRVEDLLARMTLEEKVAQMCQYVGLEHIRKAEKRLSASQLKANDAQAFYPSLNVSEIGRMTEQGLIGSFLHVVTTEEANQLQRLARKSRLKIPLIIGIDAIHGNAMVRGATVYPSPIGLASTFDTDLIERIARATSLEMRATGSHWTFSPNVDVARDARWGRVGETFGEDPYLVGELGAAMVRGYQGTDFSGPDKVIACAKHLLAGSEPVNGLNAAPMDVSLRTLKEVFLPPYQRCIDEGVYTVMAAHNELNGIPCHGSKWLMTDLLREEMRFEGFVVSDWMDIERLNDLHHVVESDNDAALLTVQAGMDMHMHGPGFLEPLVRFVKEGKLSEDRIDQSVRPILTAKFQLGLFENPLVEGKSAEKVMFCKEHRALALEAARKSIVLLKNDHILPLENGTHRRIFVTGPHADNHTTLGDWAMQQPEENVVTILEGIEQIVSDDDVVDYFDCGKKLGDLTPRLIADAAKQAWEAELAIVVVGENSLRYQWNEKTSGENTDRAQIGLVGRQLELVKAIHKTGTQTIVVLVNGRPLALPWIDENIPAIVEAWEPGSFGGQAVAELLFGEINPSGKLPISFPRSAGHIQTVYNHKPSQYFHQYRLNPTGSLYEFGEGLSFSKFQYNNLSLPEQVEVGQEVKLTVDVTNAGERAGEEVVCLYTNDVVSSVTTPVKELVKFCRVHLESGETKAVTFEINTNQLSLYDTQMKPVIEPGLFEVHVGPVQGTFQVMSGHNSQTPSVAKTSQKISKD